MIQNDEAAGWLTLAAGDLKLELAPEVGGSIAGFGIERAEGYTPIFRRAQPGFTDALQGGCFPLVPFSNRVRDGRFLFDGSEILLQPNLPPERHPLHGQGWRAPWRISGRSEFAVEMAFDHDRGEWPWVYSATQRFDLDAEGLTIRLSCCNLDDRPMPCGLGLHPYFNCTARTVLNAAVEWAWTIDEEIMPVERVPATGRYGLEHRQVCGQDLDNGFEGWSGEAEILWPESGCCLTFTCPDATRFQVYSPKAGGIFVAEPVTNANGALNLPQDAWPAAGIALLQPGEDASIVARFTVAEIA